ncbi:hypothetical protein GN958_ATG05895 [Phytophthora infestans]|uniref:Uncharacterized protein n=1 Tax=Phytophthora infestans TaxID=4787 RepID=A0A8S9UW66_PHYIN|nr:hypothetical protein GN958_ATG06805 [Phytophthora infestans]KAF4144911.1 hypothetical protein GN958_ATG05895 [Phytophthora infestans]
MELADLLRSRIKRKQEKRSPVYENTPDIVEMLRNVTAVNPPDSTSTLSEPAKMPPYISLDMYIAFREEFASGWNIWLSDEQVTKLEPKLKQEIPSMSFDENAAMCFRLSVWTNKKQDPDVQNVTEIPDGAEVYVERVTGLALFENKMAQGNTNRIEMVTKVEDTDSDLKNTTPPETESQSTEGNQTDAERLSPKLPKKRRAENTSRDVVEPGTGEEFLLAQQPNKARAPKKPKTE